MKLNAKEILKPTLVLVVICLIVTACLAGTNAATKSAIAQQEEKDTTEARQIVLPEAKTFEQANGSSICYVGKSGGKIVGYVVTTEDNNSYGGQIKVMTGIGENGTVTGVNILSSSDTPGLGLNAKKETFRDQYKQKVPDKGFEVVKGGNAKTGQINAITGATITSKAVTRAVNEAIDEYKKVTGGKTASDASAVAGASVNSKGGE